MAESTYRKIGLATVIMMVSIFLSRLLGVLRESAIAAMGGAGTAVDAYKTAFVLPEILNHVVAGGFLSITFIPIFTRYLSKDDPDGGWRIFSNIFTIFGLILSLLILISMVLAPQLVALLAPGRTDPEFFRLTIRMTRIVLPAQLFFFAGSLFMAVQFARERFLLPALAPLVYNLGIISGGLILSERVGVEGFSWGALIGAFVGSFFIQGLGALKIGMRLRWQVNLKDPDLKQYALLTIPLIFGLTMMFSTEVFSKFFGSFLPPGGISWVDYAMRIIMMLMAFFGQALGVASFPFMSKLAAQGRMEELNQLLTGALRYLALMIPISVLVWVLRTEIIRVLFERMRFSPHDTDMTALALSGLLVGATAFTAQTVVNRGFYALQNTWLPAIVSTITAIISLPVYWIGIKMLGVPGLGLAISLAAIIQVLVVYGVWNRTSGNSTGRSIYLFYAKMLILSIPLGVLLWSIRMAVVKWLNPDTFPTAVVLILLVGGAFVMLMALLAWCFKISEIQVVGRRLMKKLLKI